MSIVLVTLPGGRVFADEFVEPLEHFIVPFQAIASIQYPVALVWEDHQSARYFKSVTRVWCWHKRSEESS